MGGFAARKALQVVRNVEKVRVYQKFELSPFLKRLGCLKIFANIQHPDKGYRHRITGRLSSHRISAAFEDDRAAGGSHQGRAFGCAVSTTTLGCPNWQTRT